MDNMELFQNEQRADLTVFRVTFQTLLLQLLATRPEALVDLRTKALTALSNLAIEPTPEGNNRVRDLTMMRGEEFFREIFLSAGIAPPAQGGPRTH